MRVASGNAEVMLGETVELARIFEDRFIAAMAYSIEDGCDGVFGFGKPDGFSREEALGLIERDDTQHDSHHDLVQRIFDDALCTRFLEARDDGAHGGLIENRVYRQPVFIAEMRNGGLL